MRLVEQLMCMRAKAVWPRDDYLLLRALCNFVVTTTSKTGMKKAVVYRPALPVVLVLAYLCGSMSANIAPVVCWSLDMLGLARASDGTRA